MVHSRLAVVSLQLLFFPFQAAHLNIVFQGQKAAIACHSTRLNLWGGHTQAHHHSLPGISSTIVVLLRLRGACGDPDLHTASSDPPRVQHADARERKPLRRHVEPGGNSTHSRVRVAKYQSRILFLGQLPYDVTKEQVPPLPALLQTARHMPRPPARPPARPLVRVLRS
jgi:hypothetical protein